MPAMFFCALSSSSLFTLAVQLFFYIAPEKESEKDQKNEGHTALSVDMRNSHSNSPWQCEQKEHLRCPV
jgi:hypothetical protein